MLAYHDISTRQVLHDEIEPLLVLQKTTGCKLLSRHQEMAGCRKEEHESAGIVLQTKVQGAGQKKPQACVLPIELVCKLALGIRCRIDYAYTASAIFPSLKSIRYQEKRLDTAGTDRHGHAWPQALA